MSRRSFTVQIDQPYLESFDIEKARQSLGACAAAFGDLTIETVQNQATGFGLIVQYPAIRSLHDVMAQIDWLLGRTVPGAELVGGSESLPEGQPSVRMAWTEPHAVRDLNVTSSWPFQLLQIPDDQPAPPPERYVNTFVAASGSEEPVARVMALAADGRYDVLVNVGRYREDSLLPAGDARFPDELLPDEGIWLRAALMPEGERSAVVQPFYLPRDGDSFACDCRPGGQHAGDCARREWVRLPLGVLAGNQVFRAELVIYYEVVAVYAALLTLPVGNAGKGGPRAELVTRLTRTFASLRDLKNRTASLMVSPAADRLIVNGTSFIDNPFGLAVNAADTSVSDLRTLLVNAHLDVRNGQVLSRYDSKHAKPAAAFQTDLAGLARSGAKLYDALFTAPAAGNDVAFSMPALLRNEARVRNRPPVLQVVDGRYGERSMIWSLVYDLPLGGDVTKYQMCPSVSEFGPGGAGATEVPAVCPHEAEHEGRANVLCPFGFWGLSCIIEQPADAGRDLETVVDPDNDPLSFLVAADSSLDAQLAKKHLANLRGSLTEKLISQPSVATETELAAALSPPAMDVVYFYCHSGYDQQSRDGAADRYIRIGDYWIEPLNVSAWARSSWPYPHWEHRHPLVILNGCHTAEATSRTLNSFVPAFVQRAGASGVVGTEVTLEQGLAGWAMEQFLRSLAGATTVGEAVHRLRWTMIRQGNVMGFAYTPYCLANLAMR